MRGAKSGDARDPSGAVPRHAEAMIRNVAMAESLFIRRRKNPARKLATVGGARPRANKPHL